MMQWLNLPSTAEAILNLSVCLGATIGYCLGGGHERWLLLGQLSLTFLYTWTHTRAQFERADRDTQHTHTHKAWRHFHNEIHLQLCTRRQTVMLICRNPGTNKQIISWMWMCVHTEKIKDTTNLQQVILVSTPQIMFDRVSHHICARAHTHRPHEFRHVLPLSLK